MINTSSLQAQKKVKMKTRSADTPKKHLPKRAVLYSAILPGAGQAYNKQYWKIPIVYAALGTTYYFVRWNNKYHKKYKNAYIDYKAFLAFKYQDEDQDPPIPLPTRRSYEDLLLADVNDFTPRQEEWLQAVLLDRQKDFKKDRDLSYIIMAGFYILNIFDALVTAHLLHFDVSEDLSIAVNPYMEENKLFAGQFAGVSVNLTF